MSYKVIPNVLTILRILLILPCALAVYYDNYIVAILIFMLASITDYIDGYLARKLSCQTKLGTILDPIADKLLIISLFSIILLKSMLPFWFASIIIIRELILLGGAGIYRMLFGPAIFLPTMLSKVNTFLLLMLLSMVIFNEGFHFFDLSFFIKTLVIITLFTSIYSAADYIWQWISMVCGSVKFNNKSL